MDRRAAGVAEWTPAPAGGGVAWIVAVALGTDVVLRLFDSDASPAKAERRAVPNVSASHLSGP